MNENLPHPVVITTDGSILTPDDEEAAAALAAIAAYLQAEEEAFATSLEMLQDRWEWQASRVTMTQKIPPARMPQRPQWGNIERLRRAAIGTPGIVGM